MRGRPRAAAADSATTRYRGADGRWHARVTVGRRLDGERDRRHLSRATKRELDAAVRELENARDSGQRPWLLDNITLEQWLEHWLEEILPLSVRWKTRSGYASHLRVHVIPSIGAARLTELRPETLERLYRRLIDDGRSTHVVHGVHRVLRSSLNEAVRRHRLVTNPAALARPPRVERTEIEPLTAHECRAILQVSWGRLNAARWSVALSLGLRQGEALGLMWDDVDVDLDAGVLRVRRAVQRRTWSHGCSPRRRQEPACGHARGAQCPQRRDGGTGARRTQDPLVTALGGAAAAPGGRTARPPGRPAAAQARAGQRLGPHPRPRLQHRLGHDHRPARRLPPLEADPARRRGARGAPARRPAHRGHPAAAARASTSAPSWRSWAGPSWPPRSGTSTPSTSSVTRPPDGWGAALWGAAAADPTASRQLPG